MNTVQCLPAHTWEGSPGDKAWFHQLWPEGKSQGTDMAAMTNPCGKEGAVLTEGDIVVE